MNKRYYIVVLGILLFCFTGCGNKGLDATYQKMTELKGYQLEYRLYGLYEGNTVYDLIGIQKKDKSVNVASGLEGIEIETKRYQDVNVYLTGLKNTSELKGPMEEKIDGKTYDRYNIKVKKEAMQSLLAHTNASKLNLSSKVDAIVYLDQEGYVYRIIYQLDHKNQLSLTLTYSNLNQKS